MKPTMIDEPDFATRTFVISMFLMLIEHLQMVFETKLQVKSQNLTLNDSILLSFKNNRIRVLHHLFNMSDIDSKIARHRIRR
jgi:hypothetical protein